MVVVKESYLYILDNITGLFVPTKKAMDEEIEGAVNYLEKLIEKCLKNPSARKAMFNEGSKAKELFLKYRNFDMKLGEVGLEMAHHLYDLKDQYELFTRSDFFLCEIEMMEVVYLIGLEVTCRDAFVHEVKQLEEGVQNNLILHEAVLPTTGGRTGRFFMINCDNLKMTILEDKFKYNGDEQHLFAEDLLGANTDISIKEAVYFAREAAEKVVEKHALDELEVIPTFTQEIAQLIQTGSDLDFEAVGEKLFGEEVEIFTDYVGEIQTMGIQKPMTNETGAKVRTPKMQKIKTDTGVEVAFPFDYYNNRDYLEIVNTPNGRISIEIKNVGEITNRD